MTRRPGDDGGFGVVGVLAFGFVAATAGVLVSGLCAVATWSDRVADGADLAAMAAAAAVWTGDDPCARAGVIAERNDVRLVACTVDPAGVVRVTASRRVAVRVPGSAPRWLALRREATAGWG